MEPLVILTHIAIILLIGILCSLLAKALKLPNPLLLIIVGMFIGSLSFSGTPLIEVNQTFIIGLGTLALLMLIFDSTSRFKVSEMSKDCIAPLKTINWFLWLSIFILTFFTAVLFFDGINLASILFSLVFSVMAIETDLGSVLLGFKEFALEKSKKVLWFLENEADLNTPFIIILPFIVLELISDINLNSTNAFWAFVDKIPILLFQILLGVGVGIIVGLVLLKYMRKNYSHQFSPVAVITATLIAYLFAEQMNGNGVLAVAVMSFMFGNVYIKGKPQLEEFSSMLTNALEILVFVLLGIVIKVPLTFAFIFKSLLLFVILVAVRAIAVNISLRKEDYSAKEKLFISLNMPKGIALAAPALLLSTYPYYSLYVTLQLVVMFIIYSMLLSFIIDFYAKKMLSNGKDDKILSSSSHMRIVGPMVNGRGFVSKKSKKNVISGKKTAVKKVAKSIKKGKAKKKTKKAPAKTAKKKTAKNKAKKTKRKK